MQTGFLLSCAVGLGLLVPLAARPAASLGDDRVQEPGDQAPVTRLTIHPAAEPSPALRYRLLPSLIDMRPGNAAVFYNKAALMYSQAHDRNKELRKLEDWLAGPIESLSLAEAAEYVGHFNELFRELTYASLREDCDWQTPLREQTPYSILLPEVQAMRGMARLVAAKARLEIAQDKIDDALRSLTIGYAMARHSACGSTLIQSLVGMAIAGVMTHEAQEIAQRPDGPNLYWAYTSLPQPFVSLTRANEFEFDMFYFWHPEWRKRDGNTFSAAEWQRMWDALASGMAELGVIEADRSWSGGAGRLKLIGRAIRHYPQAKRWLLERGRSEDEVEQMPVAQVLMIYTLDTYDELRDERFKLAGLPYWQIHDRLHEDNAQLRRVSDEREVMPLAGTLLPAISNVALAQARSDRHFCLARIVEALRLYAASHDGRLPDRLADVSEVPIPSDPVTGGDFTYHLSGETAVLETPLPPGLLQRQHGLRYEITVAR
jgi:hypothetical protein